MRGRPLTPQARLAQAARTRNQAKASTSQEPPRRENEPGRRKEAVEVEDDDDEEEEDERLRREEDQRAEQRARKKGARGEAEPVIHDGPPKKKKYAVRLEEGFDVEKVIDRLLEWHNDLMTLKEILASAPRLRNELKGRLSRRLVPNVHLGTILPKEAEWVESGTKMDWKCVACGTVDLMVKGSKCAAMVDTGAEMNIIREADAIRFGMDIDRSDCGILHGANCKAMFCGTASNVLVEWMMELALASSHSLVEDMRTIEEGPDQVERHEDLMGGMYLLVNTLLQESLDQPGSLNPAGNVDEIPESQDDEFEEGEIKEVFRAEEYGGIYLELGLLLSCEIGLRDASDRGQRMLQRYLVRDGHLFVRREVGNPRRVVCGRNRQIDVVAALHDDIAGGHRGVKATYAKISELYYWDGMMDMVGKFCRSCVPCQERSRLGQGEPLHPRLEREVEAVMHLDLLFMPLGDQGYNYIFNARDNLSGFVDGRAVRTKTGSALVSCIEEYYLRYPFVREFVMDRGSEFTFQEVQELLSRSDFTKTAMPRGGKGTRPPQRPLGASGGYERHGPRHRESTPVYNDGDIELFLDRKKMKEASHEVRLKAMEMEIKELKTLVASQTAIIESLRQQTQGRVDRPESSRQGEQRQPGQGLPGQPSAAEPRQEPPIGRVIMESKEARAQRQAEREAFEFRAPTELATLPVAAAGPVVPLAVEEGMPPSSSEPAQGSAEGSMSVLLEAVHTMQEEVSLFSHEQRIEESLEREIGIEAESTIESRLQRIGTPEYGPEEIEEQPTAVPEATLERRPQRLDTPEYVPATEDLRGRLGSWATGSGTGGLVPGTEQQKIVSTAAPRSEQQGGVGTLVGSPSSPPRQPRKKKFKRKIDQLCFYCKRGVHLALDCLEFLEDKAVGKVSEARGKMYDRQGKIVEKSADGPRAQLYRQNQEELRR
ncbi:hypothetical protein CBR_g6330 [Chara braunii]|uniref:Integrase zinc-binding domain-containing protein n=1 Tax=Chara braunii TaxID=69332 RepID=A0A388KJM7_CHABU|nr:hypothetical protein CBR_g6330 [Chara braunii]|eukprot:GBG70198.1 hypothetical protein CBR_g6330 [Chara braunii]